MKLLKLTMLLFMGSFAASGVAAQANPYLNILTQNSGLVNIGGTVNVELTVGNTGPVTPIGTNKLRAQISVPSAIVSVLPNVQQTGLPPGWTITVNTGSSITVCNGSDVIAVGTARTILIKIQGNNLGGPSTINGNLIPSGGGGTTGTSCTAPGSIFGDNTADNGSTTSVEVVAVTPLTLVDFNAKLLNCRAVLNWTTEAEINTDRFEIEKGSLTNASWVSIGVVPAKGNSTKSDYSFIDKDLNFSSEPALYRLKMIDKDSHYKYSKVVNVTNNCKTIQVDVYPNPTIKDNLHVSIAGAATSIDATLISLSGQVVLRSTINNGSNYLNISNIAAGEYVLNIKDANGFDKKVKVVIQH